MLLHLPVALKAKRMVYTKGASCIKQQLSRFSYTGQEKEQEQKGKMGVLHYRARLYDPTLRRFLSLDFVKRDFARYAYVGNDPINFVDPDGKNRERKDLEKKARNASYKGWQKGKQLRKEKRRIDKHFEEQCIFAGFQQVEYESIELIFNKKRVASHDITTKFKKRMFDTYQEIPQPSKLEDFYDELYLEIPQEIRNLVRVNIEKSFPSEDQLGFGYNSKTKTLTVDANKYVIKQLTNKFDLMQEEVVRFNMIHKKLLRTRYRAYWYDNKTIVMHYVGGPDIMLNADNEALELLNKTGAYHADGHKADNYAYNKEEERALPIDAREMVFWFEDTFDHHLSIFEHKGWKLSDDKQIFQQKNHLSNIYKKLYE